MLKQIGPTEIMLVLGIVLLLVGGKKLPELARGSGKALRIFKTEVRALHDEDDDVDVESVAAITPQPRSTEQS